MAAACSSRCRRSRAMVCLLRSAARGERFGRRGGVLLRGGRRPGAREVGDDPHDGRRQRAWAVFRPAAVIDAEASLDEAGTLTSWHFLNINSGAQEVQTPYRAGKSEGRFVESSPPAAAWFLPGPGGDGEHVRPRVLHGRAGRRGRARPAGVPPRPPGARPPPGRPGGGRAPFRLVLPVEEIGAGRRRRPRVRHGQGLVRGRLRRGRGRPRTGEDPGEARLPGVRMRQDHQPRETCCRRSRGG